MKTEDRKYVRPARKILRKIKFVGLSLPLICPGKSSGQNETNHPHWVKICDNHNDQMKLRAKQRYEVLSATISLSKKKITKPSPEKSVGNVDMCDCTCPLKMKMKNK